MPGTDDNAGIRPRYGKSEYQRQVMLYLDETTAEVLSHHPDFRPVPDPESPSGKPMNRALRRATEKHERKMNKRGHDGTHR